MKVVTLHKLPTYGEAGAYLEGEVEVDGSDRATCYMSNDLWLMGRGTPALPVPGPDDEWPWYIACRPYPISLESYNTCNIYLLPPQMWSWCESLIDVADCVPHGFGSSLNLRGLADLLEACPEFELGEPVLVDQSWPIP